MSDESSSGGGAEQNGMTRAELLRRAGYAAVAASVPAWSAASARASDATSSRRAATSTLNVRTWGNYAGTLDPVQVPSFLEYQTIAPVYEGLLGWKPGSFHSYPALAEEFEALPDGRTFKFSLRRGIPFQGGYGEVTANDVVFSLIRGDTSPFNTDGSKYRLYRVRTTGKYSGKIELKQPYAPYQTESLTRWTAAIVSQAAVKHLGSGFTTQPICTGPYQVAEFNPQQGCTLTRFTDYGGAASSYAKLADWDQIVYSVILQDAPAVIGLQSGELDFSYIGPTSVYTVQGIHGLLAHPSNTLGHYILGINCQHPLLKNVNLRMAIRWAIDVNALNNGADDGLDRADAYLIEKGYLGYWAKTPVYGPDLNMARKYYQAAGSPTGDLPIQTLTVQSFTDAAEIISNQLQQIGISAPIVAGTSPDAQAWRNQQTPSSNTALQYTLTGNGFDPSDFTYPWTSQRIGISTYSYWSDSEYDNLWQKGLLVTDPTERANNYTKMQEVFAASMPTILLQRGVQWYGGKDSIIPYFHPQGFPAYHFFRGSV